VAELQERVSAAELVYWQAFFAIEAEDIERRSKQRAPSGTD
jgi:hypothetical protein